MRGIPGVCKDETEKVPTAFAIGTKIIYALPHG
jgi:hypothetical protein